MPFSAQSIEHMRQSAASSQKNDSPRGVADATATTFFAAAATANSTNNDKDGACEIKQGAPQQQLSDAAINHFTTQFITEIISNAITMMEYCGRMTLCPGDVTKSLDLFARQQAIDGACDSDIMSSDADIMDEDEDEDDEARIVVSSSKVDVSDIEKVRSGIIKLQAQVRGANVRTEKNDHVLTDYDSDSSSEDFDDDDMEEVLEYNLQNTGTPTFDEVYPTVDSMAVLSDEEYKNQVFVPTFGEGEDDSKIVIIGRSPILVMGVMKRATYAYLVKRMSQI